MMFSCFKFSKAIFLSAFSSAILIFQGAAHPSMVYTLKDIRELVEFARLRGIRIVPEFDSPGKSNPHLNIGKRWAAARQNQQNEFCAQQRHISLGIRPVWLESSLCAQWVAKEPSFLHADSEDWSDWADAHADLSLRWAHRSLCWFCPAAAQIVIHGLQSANIFVICVCAHAPTSAMRTRQEQS